jgi:hypothetical protein
VALARAPARATALKPRPSVSHKTVSNLQSTAPTGAVVYSTATRGTLQHFNARYSTALQRAVLYSTATRGSLQHLLARYSTAPTGAVVYSTYWRGTLQHLLAWYSTAPTGAMLYSTYLFSTLQHHSAQYSTAPQRVVLYSHRSALNPLTRRVRIAASPLPQIRLAVRVQRVNGSGTCSVTVMIRPQNRRIDLLKLWILAK